jgi:hypothetical protein
MNKLSVFLLLVMSSTAVASDEVKTAFYCPLEITCTEDNNLTSCSYPAQEKDYWDKFVLSWSSSTQHAGIYIFKTVMGAYESDINQIVECDYVQDENEKDGVTLYSKPQANIELDLLGGSSWFYNGFYGFCKVASASECPLQEVSGVLLSNQTDTDLLITSYPSNGEILRLSPTREGYGYTKFTSKELAYCENQETCTFQIMTEQSKRIGLVTLDMKDRMQILSLEQDMESPHQLKQVIPFNSVNIR